MAKDFLYCEETNTRIYRNDILTISTYPNVKYIAKCGWYKLGDAQKNGWYFISIADKSILPLESVELRNVIKNTSINSIIYTEDLESDKKESAPDYLYSEISDTKFYQNDLVKLSPTSDALYIVKYGAYTTHGAQKFGWYFLSLDTGDNFSVDEINLTAVVKDDEFDISLFWDIDAISAQANYIVIPHTSIRLYEGDIVKISNKPTVKWVVHLGWYIYNEVQNYGWYFESVKDGEILPVSIVDLTLCTLVTVKTQGSVMHDGKVVNYTRPFTLADAEILNRTFITLDTIEQRDNIDKKKLINGKMVRVNSEEGPAQYYAWNAETETWEFLEVFGIPEIVGSTQHPAILSELEPGLYRVKGTYKISPTYEMITLTPIDHIVFVSDEGDIKVVTESTITDYIVEDDDVTFVNNYATYRYLQDNYATKIYVDDKIAVIEAEISEIISEFHDKVIEIVYEVLGEALNSIDEDYIDDLFE